MHTVTGRTVHRPGERTARPLRILTLLAALLSAVTPGSARAASVCDSLSTGRFDEIYICPTAWRTQVARLAAHRATTLGGGYGSIIAPAESIAACFGAGRTGIRAMLAGALSTWSTSPRHIILVGGFDDIDTSRFVLPTWFLLDPDIGFWTRTVPTDDPYVFAPTGGDSLPAVSIGRIPAWSGADLGVYIDKVISYETAGTPMWKKTALHVVEDRDLDGSDGTTSRRHADSLAVFFGPREEYNFSRSGLYGTDAGVDENAPVLSAWNSGVGFVFFYGTTGNEKRFGFFWQFGTCGSPRGVFEGALNGDSLVANGKAAVVFGLTCGLAYPRGAPGGASRCGTLAQYLLFAPSAGAVSITGPSRAMHESPGYPMAKAWFASVFASNTPGSYREPGLALRDVKRQVGLLQPSMKTEVLEMMTLGDPALQFYVGGSPTVAVPSEADRDPHLFRVRQLGVSGQSIRFAVDLPRAGQYSFTLFDVLGRAVQRMPFRAMQPEFARQIVMPTARAPAGVYFLRGQGIGLVSSTKVLILK